MTKKIISIVVPVFNEVKNIQRAYLTICNELDKNGEFDFEVIFTDNHSDDGSFELLGRLDQSARRGCSLLVV
jgi:dolichol-phosphate mannosyltransferase